MRLISSTLLTIAFLVLFAIASPMTTSDTSSDKPVPTVQEGGACIAGSSLPEESCGRGLRCDSNGVTTSNAPGYCVKRKIGLALGDVCVSKGCKSGLVCKSDPTPPPTTGKQANVPKGKCATVSA
jgi:hypothetical protein